MLKASSVKSSSAHYRLLVKRRNQLKARLLDFSSDPPQSTLPTNQEKLRSFKLLMHAEIEHYLESITRDTLLYCRVLWCSSHELNKILLNLLIYNQFPYAANGSDGIASDRVTRLIDYALNSINDNHGVKEKNILKLFQPIGVSLATNYSTLLADLESYGSDRGSIAHLSYSAIRKTLIKRVELAKTVDILKQLHDLDREVIQLQGCGKYSVRI